MKKILNSLLTTAILTILAALQSCEINPLADEKGILSKEKKFDVDLFDQNIKAGLGEQWTGYTYVINQNGNYVHSGKFGKWVQGFDGSKAADLNTNLYAASVSKMITAVALLKAMDENANGAVSMLNAPIQSYLPVIWNVNPSVSQLTFRQLLQHRSGFAPSVTPDYNGVKNAVTVQPLNFNYAYSNGNYGLIRILMYRLITNKVLNDIDDVMDASSTNAFEEYVREKLFEPLDIKASVRPSTARYYRWGDPANTPGWDIGNRQERLGSGGWHISPVDLAKFLAYLNNTETILTKETRQLMYTLFLGWSDGAAPSNTPNGEHGLYYFKGGSFCNAGGNNACNGQGVRTLVATFPNKVELVIMANNQGNNMSLNNMVITSFDNAWK